MDGSGVHVIRIGKMRRFVGCDRGNVGTYHRSRIEREKGAIGDLLAAATRFRFARSHIL